MIAYTVNGDGLYEILESYKQKIGESNNYTDVISYDSQLLEQIIEEENHKIRRSISKIISEKNNLVDIQIKYHESEISNNRRINILLICMIAAGMLFITIGIIGRISNLLQDASITIIGGIVTEGIGALIKIIQTASDKSKYKYFESLIDKENRDNIIELVKNMKVEKERTKMIEKLIDGNNSK